MRTALDKTIRIMVMIRGVVPPKLRPLPPPVDAPGDDDG